MPKELKLQKELVDVVNDNGGFAFKLSNRFLVGVLDLFIKTPLRPATMLECKQDKLPKKLQHVVVTLTPLQWRFARRAFDAGMESVGVVSFLQDDTSFGMRIIPISSFAQPVEKFMVAEYASTDLKGRKRLMLEVLMEYINWGRFS